VRHLLPFALEGSHPAAKERPLISSTETGAAADLTLGESNETVAVVSMAWLLCLIAPTSLDLDHNVERISSPPTPSLSRRSRTTDRAPAGQR
jgi:hypothetical protein